MRHLAEEPGLEIVGDVADERKICEWVHQTRPNLLVIALDEPSKRTGIRDVLLREHPKLRIIAGAARQNAACFIEVGSPFIAVRSNRPGEAF